jgi:ABC-type dipeptide/oligopeptide/nickel transport system ATPase component
MILGIVGEMGSGKTLLMTYFLYGDFLENRQIYSNYHLEFKYSLIKLKELIEKAKHKEQLKNATIGIDEIHIFFESRRSGSKKNIVGSYLVTQSRKRSLDIVYTTQFFYQVEKRIRDNTQYLIRSHKVADDVYQYEFHKRVDTLTIEGGGGEFQLIKTFIIRHKSARAIYKLYDTEEVIMDLGEDELDDEPKPRAKKIEKPKVKKIVKPSVKKLAEPNNKLISKLLE